MVFNRSFIILLVIIPLLTNGQEQLHVSSDISGNQLLPNHDGKSLASRATAESDLDREGRLVGNQNGTDMNHPIVDGMLDGNKNTSKVNSTSATTKDGSSLDSITTTTESTFVPVTASANPKFTTVKQSTTTTTTTTAKPNSDASTTNGPMNADNNGNSTKDTNSATSQGFSLILFGLAAFFLI